MNSKVKMIYLQFLLFLDFMAYSIKSFYRSLEILQQILGQNVVDFCKLISQLHLRLTDFSEIRID